MTGRARKPLYDPNPNKTPDAFLTIRVTPQQKEALEREGRVRRVSQSQVIRELIQKALVRRD